MYLIVAKCKDAPTVQGGCSVVLAPISIKVLVYIVQWCSSVSCCLGSSSLVVGGEDSLRTFLRVCRLYLDECL